MKLTTTAIIALLSLPLTPTISCILSLLKNPTLEPLTLTLNLSSNLHYQARRHSPQMPPSIIAEYAKSKRSTCKTCSNAIAANALRLGVVSRDKDRGFDMTKWHHFECFSFRSLSVASVESIAGFNSLTIDDQEALKKLVEKRDKFKDTDEADRDEQKSAKKMKIRDRDEEVAAEDEQKSTKKANPAASEDAKIEIALTLSEIKDKYKEATLLPKWKAFHSVIFLEKDVGLQDSSKIAAFDFDGCLVNTSVKIIGADAWSLLYPSIPDKLQKLYNDGFKLVIFTNESNIDRWKNKRQVAVESKVGRLSNFMECVKVPMQVFIACGFDTSARKDPYRKPRPGMWHVMEEHFNSGIPIDMDHSFYVGDAAGRINDHSDADIKFAEAIGLKFHVPEDFFSE